VSSPSGVPASLSSFIGRKKEIGSLRRLLSRTRILTLLGPGGCGKTRLAVELARQQQSRFRDGSILVELATVRQPDLVADAVARAAGITLGLEAEFETLVRRLKGRQILFLLDNCEHLVGSVATVVTNLLLACPNVSVLATSRERLNVEGETVFRVPPLQLPKSSAAMEEALTADSIRFFIDRARSVRPDLLVNESSTEAIASICRRLDGMPLSIELAAARVITLSPVEILPRLDDRFRLLTGGRRHAIPRQQALRGTIDWSYDLLNPEERQLLGRMSLFSGDFGADAVEAVCAQPPLDSGNVLDALGRLADKSMVQVEADAAGTIRYRLLETIREYAAEKVSAAGEVPALRDRHLAYYVELAREAFEKRIRVGAMAEHRRLWAEIGEVRAALEWCRGDSASELDLLSNLYLIWMIYAPAEGFRRLDEALAASALDDFSRPRMRAIWVWSALGGRGGVGADRLMAPEQIGEMSRRSGDALLAAKEQLGHAYQAERLDRDLEKARLHLRLAVDAHQKLGAGPDLAMALCSLGSVEMQMGNLEAAGAYIQQGLELALAVDDQYGAVGAYFTRGWLELERGATAEARASFMAALELAPDGDLLSLAYQLEGVGCTLVAEEPERALAMFGAAARMRAEIATALALPWSERAELGMAGARGALSPRAAAAAWERGQRIPHAQVVGSLTGDLGAHRAARTANTGGLSRRELEIARLVATGLTNRAIAERLFLAERTVESHVDHILNKLDFRSRAQLAAWISEQRLGEVSAQA
jgi:non-specific serine/threonine protein kinase